MSNIERKIEALRAKIRDTQHVQSLAHHAGWQVVADFLSATIQHKRSQLESDDVDWAKVQVLRAEIRILQNMLRTPDIRQEDLDKWVAQVASMESRATMLRNAGLLSAEPQGVIP